MTCLLCPKKRPKNSGRYFQKNWEEVCGTLPKTLTLFQTKICDFLYPISDLIKHLIPQSRSQSSSAITSPVKLVGKTRIARSGLGTRQLIPYFRPEALEPGAWPERVTRCYGTCTVVGVNIKREMVLSPNDEEVANSSKKHTQFKTRVHKTYPISDQNAYKKHTLRRGTYLYSRYKGLLTPPPSGRKTRSKLTISLIHAGIHAWTCSRKQQMHNSWIFTVFSNMANHSFHFFASFSINDWKENVESLNNSPFWEETQSFICFCQLTVNETVFLSLLANAVNSGYDRGERCLSAVQCSLPC